MTRKIAAVLVCALLVLTVPFSAFAESGGSMDHFQSVQRYDGRFEDVPEGSWYFPNVSRLYEMGLVNGQSSHSFAPQADITLAEAISSVARLRSLYLTGDAEAGPSACAVDGEPWYGKYVTYLKEQKVIGDTFDGRYGESATRAEVAGIIAGALREETFAERNATAVKLGYEGGGYIKDVTAKTPYQEEILQLYRWGILSGMDGKGSYHPQEPISRAEATALLTRMADPSLRQTLRWDVSPYYTAVGTGYEDLIKAGKLRRSHDLDDLTAIDGNVRYMLSQGGSTLELQLAAGVVNKENVSALMSRYLNTVRTYIEQGYNAVDCTYSASTGRVTLRFSCSVIPAAKLPAARETTLSKAIAVHDMLWRSGSFTADMTQYDKARVLYTWICDNAKYDYSAKDTSQSHTAYSLFTTGNAVCDGYTAAYNLLLKLSGIDCTIASTTDHIWTVAKLDGKTYHIDTTWGDQTGTIRYEYFAMTEAESMGRF